MSTLKTRKPTGRPSWPLILLAGEAKTGKTYRAAEFSGDPRVGRTFWLDLGEGCADEYGAVPGADYEIIEHDGTWGDIIGQVSAVRDIAREAIARGEKPVVLVIDSMTAEWAMLSAWADLRARRSTHNRKELAVNPDAEIDISANYWNDANSRHNRLMNILKTFPGIVVMTALETEKTQFGPNGKPVKNAPKTARPDAQKRLAADSTVWVRLSLDHPPTVVGIRSANRVNITPGVDRPKVWPDFTLAKLVFDHMGIGEEAQARDIPVLDADQVAPEESGEPDGDAAPARPRTAEAPRSVRRETPRADTDPCVDRACVLARQWLTVGDLRGLHVLYAETKAAPDTADVDVASVLTEEDRERLRVTASSVALKDLVVVAGKFVSRFRRPVRAAQDAAAGVTAGVAA